MAPTSVRSRYYNKTISAPADPDQVDPAPGPGPDLGLDRSPVPGPDLNPTTERGGQSLATGRGGPGTEDPDPRKERANAADLARNLDPDPGTENLDPDLEIGSPDQGPEIKSQEKDLLKRKKRSRDQSPDQDQSLKVEKEANPDQEKEKLLK